MEQCTGLKSYQRAHSPYHFSQDLQKLQSKHGWCPDIQIRYLIGCYDFRIQEISVLAHMTEAIYPSSLVIDHVHWPLWHHHAQIMGLETKAACYSGNDFENKKVFFLPVKCKVDKYGLHKSITILNKKN